MAIGVIKALYDRVKALESENAELKTELKSNCQSLGQPESMIEKILTNQNNGSDKLASNR